MLDEDLRHRIQRGNLNYSSTKPLYITQVGIENENTASPLADSTYECILSPIIRSPLQNVKSTISSLANVRKNLLMSGLYTDVEVQLSTDKLNKPLDCFTGDMLQDLNTELPILTTATLKLHPEPYYKKLLTTFETTDRGNTINVYQSWKNLLGTADVEMVEANATFNPVSNTWSHQNINAMVSLPFKRDLSLRNIFGFKAYSSNSQPTTTSHIEINMGIQKNWLCNDASKTLPYFYTGILVLNNPGESLNSTVRKLSVITKYAKDARTFYGTFPISGYNLDIVNESAICGFGNPDPIQHRFFAKYELHRSYLHNWFTTSVNVGIGNTPFSNYLNLPVVSLKGPQIINKTQNRKELSLENNDISCNIGFMLSHKLPNLPVKSPLRLQYFMDILDVVKGNAHNFSEPDINLGTSLVFKTKEVDMNISYQVPMKQSTSIKQGLTFDVCVSYF